ncbi:hypothetical protein [Iningainema tapete]|uniref:Uncharacterized protein n=1 Tax=Iningainema tapete BLCC-T55 TaxID=2748662 RepID=A0A8J6XLH5_9CYAN|nr:hypothetical protein [Iningainema tapete]MBD2773839.1 hypothetical protein [Iningainema tapete BLCC-T55]
MLKKTLALGLVAAAMLIAPTTAQANDQDQYNQQITEQDGKAIDYSTNVQNAESSNNQEQYQENRYRRGRDRDREYDRDRKRDRRYDRDRDREYDRDRKRDRDYYRH